MRLPHLALAPICALALVAAGCGEKESGIGAGQKKTAAQKKAPSAQPAPSGAQGVKVSQEAAARKKPKITVPKSPAPAKLVVKDLAKGTGATLKPGDQIAVNYSGVTYSKGQPFDNSFDRGQPFQFQLGTGGVIPGWDQGLVGAKVGARRELIIPAKLAYGAQGSPPKIGPNEPLVFVIDVLAKK